MQLCDLVQCHHMLRAFLCWYVCDSLHACELHLHKRMVPIAVPSNVNQVCNDGDATTIGDACTASGVCLGTKATCANTGVVCSSNLVRTDSALCTLGVNCTSQACCVSFCLVSGNVGKACNDNDATTFNDVCVAGGQCQGTPATCSNQNVQCSNGFVYPSPVPACTPGVNCNTATCCVALCAVSANNGLTCNDNNALTINDRCTNGQCIGTLQSLRVSSVVVTFVLNASGKYVDQATVTVVNQSNVAMGSVAVTGNFKVGTTTYAPQAGTTNASGVATVVSTTTWAKANNKVAGSTFCVTNLALSGYQYTAGTVCGTVQ